MKTEKVYSPIFDKDISKDISNSPIWSECYKEEEIPSDKQLYVYSIKFDGLTPVQVTNIKKYK